MDWDSLDANLPHCKVDEDLIQGSLADGEVLDLQSGLVRLQLVKDVRHTSRCHRHMILHHGRVLVLEVRAGEVALHEIGDDLHVTGRHSQVHLHREAAAKPVLDVLQGAQTPELTLHHDGQTGAKSLALLHTVRGENYSTLPLDFL